MNGIDVSSHNPPQNWHQRIAEGIEFAGFRISSGTSLDVAAEAHLDGAFGAGLRLLLGYHYLTMADPAAQARVFLERVAAIELLIGQDLALAVDMEDIPGKPPWPREAYEAVGRELIRIVRETKRRPCAVYLSPAFAAELGLSWWFADSPLWLARWAPQPGDAPHPWTRISIWQNAVIGALDRDVFTGTAEDWRRVFGLGTWAAPLDVLGGVMTTSDAAAGKCGGAEVFCNVKEGPS